MRSHCPCHWRGRCKASDWTEVYCEGNKTTTYTRLPTYLLRSCTCMLIENNSQIAKIRLVGQRAFYLGTLMIEWDAFLSRQANGSLRILSISRYLKTPARVGCCWQPRVKYALMFINLSTELTRAAIFLFVVAEMLLRMKSQTAALIAFGIERSCRAAHVHTHYTQ